MKPPEDCEHYSNDGRLRYCPLLKLFVHVCEKKDNPLHYVDGCHAIARTKEGILHVYTEIQKCFKLRDLGPTSWFLGIDIQRNCSVGLITPPQHSIHRWYGGPFTCQDIHGPRPAPGKACESSALGRSLRQVQTKAKWTTIKHILRDISRAQWTTTPNMDPEQSLLLGGPKLQNRGTSGTGVR